MFKKLPGDEARNLVSTTPDTAVVFRPAVVTTPAFITFIVYGWRAVSALALTPWRHPIACAVPGLLGFVWAWYGWPLAACLLGCIILALTSWAFIDRKSFSDTAGYRLLAWWRLMSVYRRHWQSVMDVSGLAKRVHGRDYLPRLVKVTCDGWADRITVKMLKGQAVKDWTDKTDNLAQGFGVTSCRIALVKGGRLVLTFPAPIHSPPRFRHSPSPRYQRSDRSRSASRRTASRYDSRSTAHTCSSRAPPGPAKAPSSGTRSAACSPPSGRAWSRCGHSTPS
ncbi:hypothetical protein AB0C18_12830 [Nonomuraea muscovyensis]